MNFCSSCGHRLHLAVPPGDDRTRFVCDACGTVHYQNPRVVVGCIPEHEGRVLLCRRAIEPRHGLWTLPAGYLENGETLAAGAERETREEAGAHIGEPAPYLMFNICHISQIYLMFRARLMDLEFAAGKESLEVKLFTEEEIPWDRIAFRVISETLKTYWDDRRRGSFPFALGDIDLLPEMGVPSRRRPTWGP
ncbi:MAG: NUDIX hydrolase [Desulfobacterales bacterium]|jgi:ADP-ribose pyrophosphatase YjhB (NUDIX family)|nr:NUDIX hydrolase [Desulfobacterales bacterium]